MYASNSSFDHNVTKTLLSQYLLVSKPSTSQDNFNLKYFDITQLKVNKKNMKLRRIRHVRITG